MSKAIKTFEEAEMSRQKLYIANDVEAAGHRLGIHSTLSIGACVVMDEPITFDEANARGLVFYAELQPLSLDYVIGNMKIGCLHLKCLDDIRKTDPRYDPLHPKFAPMLVLELMEAVCESPKAAVKRFYEWVEQVRGSREVEAVTDTVFFDSGHFNLNFGLHHEVRSPYKWHGLDLSSMYRGHTGDPDARLNGLGVPDDRAKPHRADHDAYHLAKVARKLLVEELHWRI